MGNLLKKQRSVPLSQANTEESKSQQLPPDDEKIEPNPTDEIKIQEVDPEPMIKLVTEPEDPELEKELDFNEPKPEKIEIETPKETTEVQPKKKRTMTVMDSFRKLVGGSGESENRTITQYSSFRSGPQTGGGSEKFLDKKKSFTDTDAELFTILCIGAGGAGKSTFCRQLNFEEKENQPQKRSRSTSFKITSNEVIDTSNPYMSYKPSIIKNIWEIAYQIMLCIQTKYPDYHFEHLTSEHLAEIDKYNHAVVSELERYTNFVHQAIILLTKEPIYHKIMEDHAQKDFFVHEGLTYQFKRENLSRYTPGFIPTKEDVLNCHQKTSGIDKVIIQVNSDTKIKLFDTGGQRNERKKWKMVYGKAQAVIFIASLNEFNQLCYEDDCTNRTLESLQLFEETINLEIFKDLKKILLLNKVTAFKQTLKESKLSDVFPEFKGESDFEMALDFIMTEFQKRYKGDIKKFKIFTFDSIDQKSAQETFTKCKDFFDIDVTW